VFALDALRTLTRSQKRLKKKRRSEDLRRFAADLLLVLPT
jgi:hypothetical protein